MGTQRMGKLSGSGHDLWRTVNQYGVVLDILVQGRRNSAAAGCLFEHSSHELQFKPRQDAGEPVT
jgi:transposase-like protein